MDTNVLQFLTTHRSGNDTVMLVLVALAPTLASLAAYLKARAAVVGVKEVHLAINSRLDEWLKVERAQGVETGRQTERDFQKKPSI